MLAEIPTPACVGSNSPFLPAIKAARKTFDSHYHVTGPWIRMHIPVTVQGAGFFGFLHG
jgi:hypothetical protein